MDYILSCCSTADCPKEWFEARDVRYVCSHYRINEGKTLPDDLGQSTPFPEFYQLQREGALTSTSQISPGEYEEYFESLLRENKNILHISLSSGITTTCQSAILGAESLKEKYPDCKIVIIDSLAVTIGFGLLVSAAADLRDSGMPFEELCEWITEKRHNLNGYGCTDDLSYLIRGGRLNKLSGTVGQILNICPILYFSYDGRLKICAKIRTLKKSLKYIVDIMKTRTENGTDYEGDVYIGHADNIAGANVLSAMITEQFQKLKRPPVINYIGTTIGSHTGPGLLAVAFFGKERAL